MALTVFVPAVTGRCTGYDSSSSEYWMQLCSLTAVPQDIPAEAVEVDLSINQISDIPEGALSHLSHCARLNLYGNRLTELRPGMFQGLRALETLALSRNRITTIQPRTFQELRALVYLDLGSNRITTIQPHTFQGLRALEGLYLSSNDITTIQPRTFAGLKQLRTLWLHSNKLTTCEEAWFDPGYNFTELSLSENPLQCDRRMCWIKQAERDKRITWYTDPYDGEVYKPDCENYKGVDWDDVTLTCPASGKCC